MSSNITVEISADVTKLKTQLSIASAELRDSASEVKKMAREYVGAADDIKASMLPQLEAATVAEAKLRGEVAKLSAEIREQGESTSSLKRIEEAIGGVGEKAEALNSRIGVFSRAGAAVGELAVAGFGLEAAFEQVNKVTETGEAIGKLSEATGIGTEQLSALRVVATETGTDFEKLQGGFRQLAANMQEALINPASTAGQAFQAMGIKVDDGNGHLRDAGTVLAELSAKLASYKESTDKTELAADTLGKKFGSDLIPVMNRLGTEGFDKLIEHAKDLNQNFTGEDVEAATKYQENLKQLELDFQGITRSIVDAALPALNAFAYFFHDSSEIERYTADLGQMQTKLQQLKDIKAGGPNGFRGGTHTNIDAAIADLQQQIEMEKRLIALREHPEDFKTSHRRSGQRTADAASSADAPSVGNTIAADKAAKAALEVKLATFDQEIKAAKGNAAQQLDLETQKLAAIKAVYGENSKQYQEELGRQTELSRAGDKTELDSKLANYDRQIKGAKDNFSAQIALENQKLAAVKAAYGEDSKEYQNELERKDELTRQHNQLLSSLALDQGNTDRDIARIGIAAKRDILDSEVNDGKITNQQKIAALEQLADQEYRLDLQGLQDEVRLLDLSVTERQRVNDQILKLQAQHVADMAKLSDQMSAAQKKDLDKTSKDYQTAFQPIGRAFDQTITGVLQGTQTLQQAEARLAQSLVLSFVSAEEQKLQKYIASQLAQISITSASEASKTGAVAAGALARTTVETAAAAEGKAAKGALDSSSIMKSAYTAAANTYAAISAIPVIGPFLAPVAAAGAFAAVAAFDVVSAEGGLERVGMDNQPAFLHKDEAVLPARIARPLLEMAQGGGSGGGNVVNNITLNHSSTGAQDPSDLGHRLLMNLNDAFRSDSTLKRYGALSRALRR